MGRPRIENARTVSIGTRLTPEEAAEIDAARGSMSRTSWLRTVALAATRRTVTATPATSTAATGYVQPVTTEPSHRHRRDHVIGQTYVKGALVEQYACDCGKVLQN